MRSQSLSVYSSNWQLRDTRLCLLSPAVHQPAPAVHDVYKTKSSDRAARNRRLWAPSSICSLINSHYAYFCKKVATTVPPFLLESCPNQLQRDSGTHLKKMLQLRFNRANGIICQP